MAITKVHTSLLTDGANFIKKDGTVAMTGNLAMGAHKVTGLAEPTISTDAATKSYVDGLATGLKPHQSVAAATTGNITLYGTQTIDGINVIEDNRVLVWCQSDSKQNGIYDVQSTAWTRSVSEDTIVELAACYVWVDAGTLNGGRGYVCTNTVSDTLGVTNIVFLQFATVGRYTGGTGITVGGSTISLATHLTGDYCWLITDPDTGVPYWADYSTVRAAIGISGSPLTKEHVVYRTITTANDVLTTFTITAIDTTSLILVFVDGIYQKLTDDYSFGSTTSITFTYAPPTGANIVIIGFSL